MREMRIAYLRKCCPGELGHASRDVLAKHVLASEGSGRQLGLVSEAAHCSWAYLMFATRGLIAASPDVVNYIRDGGPSPDRQVGLVLKSTVAELRRPRAEIGMPHELGSVVGGLVGGVGNGLVQGTKGAVVGGAGGAVVVPLEARSSGELSVLSKG